MRHLVQHAVLAAIADPAAGGGASTGPVTYTLDPGHTEVIARWKHFGFSTPAGLRTTVPRQDEHLRSEEFFDAAKFPDIHFQSTKVERGATASNLRVTGNLTVHGVSKPVTLAVTVNQVGLHAMHNAQAAGFDATAHVNRSEFGMGAHVPAVSDRIDLRITAEAIESTAWKAILDGQAG